ncbi:hypothetical protein C0Q70_19407 [Pomacea canaliculata]|uniref:Uncharacterized protein n=1 Tax=Pomacea canaliculata TaxID=400727 RepID=A0A2T7NJB0_POMCA|nr:hypothetical protein C0Q70_19407 [Pomacea canaliculata]
MAALWASESNYVCVRYRAYRFDVILSVLPSRNPSLRQVQTGSLTNSHSPNDCPASHSLAGGGRAGGERESEPDNLSAATSLRERVIPARDVSLLCVYEVLFVFKHLPQAPCTRTQ